jgi:hypothetical protein
MAVFIVRVGSSYGGSASVLPNEIRGGASSSTGPMTSFDGQADTRRAIGPSGRDGAEVLSPSARRRRPVRERCCANLLRLRMAMPQGAQRRSRWERLSLRGLVAFLTIFILTVSLAGRTFDPNLHSRTSVASQTDKAKIQHRHKSGSQWAPALDLLKPFYVAVCSQAVDPEQEPLFSPHVDDCLYNRPPPLS